MVHVSRGQKRGSHTTRGAGSLRLSKGCSRGSAQGQRKRGTERQRGAHLCR